MMQSRWQALSEGRIYLESRRTGTRPTCQWELWLLQPQTDQK